jgi:hypothetical protein
MTELRDQISAYQHKKGNRSSKAQFSFDIVSWLESKIEKRPFAEIVRKKSEKYLK